MPIEQHAPKDGCMCTTLTEERSRLLCQCQFCLWPVGGEIGCYHIGSTALINTNNNILTDRLLKCGVPGRIFVTNLSLTSSRSRCPRPKKELYSVSAWVYNFAQGPPHWGGYFFCISLMNNRELGRVSMDLVFVYLRLCICVFVFAGVCRELATVCTLHRGEFWPQSWGKLTFTHPFTFTFLPSLFTSL